MENESPTSAPVPKVSAATIGAALAAIVFWLVRALTDLEPTPEVALAAATLLAFLAGYFTPPKGWSGNTGA